MIFSIHVPKTAGTGFRKALEARYGERLACFYGASDPKTHPLLRVARRDLAAQVPMLRERGFEVLHGHYGANLIRSEVTDPSRQVWIWLRDPVDRTLSHYSFYRERPTSNELGSLVRDGDLSLEDFSRTKQIRNLQARYLGRFKLSECAFVGITERFELCMALLFGEDAPHLPRRYNTTVNKAKVDARSRMVLAALNTVDGQLYAEAKLLLIDRLAELRGVESQARPEAARPGAVGRLFARVAAGVS